MTASKRVWSVFGGTVGATAIFVILLLHNAWGDERYVLKEEALIEQIARIDTQLSIYEIEILFAESPKEKQKFEAIKLELLKDKAERERKLNNKT